MELDRFEGAFYDYMHRLGEANWEWNSGVLSFYVPMFTNCQRVLDIGCGEGQFIQLLQDEGVKVIGIDADATMVEACQRKGLEVVYADLFDYLPQHEGQFDGVFCSNVIEHLSAQEAVRFAKAAYRALSPGGRLLVATPNPASLIVHLHEFWRDPTHVRLYNRSLLEFLFHWAGFEEIESGENPHTAWTSSDEMQEVPLSLKEIESVKKPYTAWTPSDEMQEVSLSSDEIGFGRDLYISWAPSDAMQAVPEFRQEPSVTERAPARDQAKMQSLEAEADGFTAHLRRMVLSFLRALGRLLVRYVLFEEFAARDRKIGRIRRELGRIDERLGRTDEQIGHLQRQMSRINRQFFRIDSRFGRIDGQFGRIDGQLGRIDGQLGRIDNQFGRIDGQFGRIRQIEHAMYHSQDRLLSRPREVFATGVRPLSEPGG